MEICTGTVSWGAMAMLPAWLRADGWDKAKEILKSNNIIVSVTEIIGVELSDKPGALTNVMAVLDAGQVNVEYVYAFVTPGKAESAYMAVRVGDNEKATAVLNAAGIHTLDQKDLEAML